MTYTLCACVCAVCVRECMCVLSMAKWVTLICTAKQISASQTRKMSFVFKDAGRVEQERWKWKTAESEGGSEGVGERVKLKEML